MLSFMREQESKGAAGPAGAGPQGAPSPNEAGAQEYLTVAANSKNVRRSTILVAVLVGIGLVCLLLMIRKTQPSAAAGAAGKDDQTKIEAAISRLTGVRSEMAVRMDEIVKKFYEFSDVSQVKVNELAKDPFVVQGSLKDFKPEVMAIGDPQEQAEFIRRQRLQKQVSALRLLSIMRSDRGNACMINDQILRPGEVIDDFTVVEIGSSSVTLLWQPTGLSHPSASPTEEKIVLKLSE